MIAEHESVVLLHALPAMALMPGDVGVVVHVYEDGRAYEVEFLGLDGHTTAVATVEANQVRTVTRNDMAHCRTLHTP